MNKSNDSNILVEYESLKSLESIFKMKETNYLRDKEILEDSIKHLQKEIQDKALENRQLRRENDGHAAKFNNDLNDKCHEIDDLVVQNNEIKKHNVILEESLKQQKKRNDELKAQLVLQKTNFEKESCCKSKLAEFHENNLRQKEKKNSQLQNENDVLKCKVTKLECDIDANLKMNFELSKKNTDLESDSERKINDKDMELQKLKLEINQLQQSGVSEFNLEKINPKIANTLKIMKSTTSLIDIYSELHTALTENDKYQLDIKHLSSDRDNLLDKLNEQKALNERVIKSESELQFENTNLKRRLVTLVSEYNNCKSEKETIDRNLLMETNRNEECEQEIKRLNEQIRLLLVSIESGMDIKKEEIDEDSDLIWSITDLQEMTRKLRNENERLKVQLDNNDENQYRDRYNELNSYCQNINDELERIGQERDLYKSRAELHEKQVSLLGAILRKEGKHSDSANTMNNHLENSCNISKNDGENDNLINDKDHTFNESIDVDEEGVNITDSERLVLLEQEIADILDNKKASDLIYQDTIEDLRVQLKQYFELYREEQLKLDTVNNKLKEEDEACQNYRNESELLRLLNLNLSSNTANLESEINEYRVKCDNQSLQLIQMRGELSQMRNQLNQLRHSESRLKIEKNELKKSWEQQEQIIMNINSVKAAFDLQDHLVKSRLNEQYKQQNGTLEALKNEIEENKQTILSLTEELEKNTSELAKLNEKYGLGGKLDFQCQAELGPVGDIEQHTTKLYELQITLDETELKYQSQLTELQQSEQVLQCKIRDLENDNAELKKNCEFSQSQIVLLETSRQEIIGDNIKLTEENDRMINHLKQELKKAVEDLDLMKIRLTEAEEVEKSAQSVIDKYLTECNEAKIKYQRELTLHANDSKMLEQLNREVELVNEDTKKRMEICEKLEMEIDQLNNMHTSEVDKMNTKLREVENQLQESELRNDRLYKQLCQITSGTSNSEYAEIIEDLRNQINVVKVTNVLSTTEIERYELQISELQSELEDVRSQSVMNSDINNSRTDNNNSALNTSHNSIVDNDVVEESNHILRKQKLELERLNLIRKNEIDDFKIQIEKYHNDFSNLQTQYNVLEQTKKDTESERSRWKERCTKLMERAEQMDPEQYRLVCNERDKLKKQISVLESDLLESKSNIDKFQSQLASVKSQLNDMTEKLKEKENIIVQLKEIAKKYKSESVNNRQVIESLQTEIERYKELASQNETEKLNILETNKSELISKQTQIDELLMNNQTLTTNLSSAEQKFNESQTELDECRKQNNELINKSNVLNKDLETIQQNMNDSKSQYAQISDTYQRSILKCEDLKSKLDITKNKLNDEISNLTEMKMQNDIMKSMQSNTEQELNIAKLDLIEKQNQIDQLMAKCATMENIEKENSKKLQLTENIISRLQNEKRKIEEDDNDAMENEPTKKKVKLEDEFESDSHESSLGDTNGERDRSNELMEIHNESLPDNKENIMLEDEFESDSHELSSNDTNSEHDKLNEPMEMHNESLPDNDFSEELSNDELDEQSVNEIGSENEEDSQVEEAEKNEEYQDQHDLNRDFIGDTLDDASRNDEMNESQNVILGNNESEETKLMENNSIYNDNENFCDDKTLDMNLEDEEGNDDIVVLSSDEDNESNSGTSIENKSGEDEDNNVDDFEALVEEIETDIGNDSNLSNVNESLPLEINPELSAEVDNSPSTNIFEISEHQNPGHLNLDPNSDSNSSPISNMRGRLRRRRLNRKQ